MIIGIDIRLIGKKRTGDEVVIFNLVRQFVRINTNHKFIFFTDVTDSNTLEDISKQLGIKEKKNFNIVSLETPNRFAWNFWTLPMYLKKNPVDVYHTQYITPWFVPGSIKIVTIVHDISFNFFSKFIRFSDLLFLRTLMPISIKRAEKIVGVSKFTHDEIIKYYKISPEKVDWIHNDISVEFRKKVDDQTRVLVRNKYKLPEKFILYVGTMQPRKNLPMLLEAFEKIKDDLNGMKIVLCGNRTAHNYDNKIDQTIIENKLQEYVVFPGFIDEEDKPAIFNLSEVFVFPSFYEGFGIPVLEAMSQGVPVICSDIPSLKEIAAGGALYFDVNNLDDFSKKLYDISMNKSLRNELIHAGLQRVSSFSWEKSANKMLAIYESLQHN